MALNATLQPFAAALSAQSAQDDQQKGQIADLGNQLQTALDKVDALQNTITALSLDDETAQAMVASLTPKLAAAQAQVAALQAQLAAAQPTVWADLEYQNWLTASGTAANTGTTGNTATSTQTLPGVASATRGIQPAGAYADKYWYFQLGPNPSYVRFKQEYSFLFPTTADSTDSQAVETDLQQCIGGIVFNWGFQFDFAENEMRVWNRSGGNWVALPGVACPRYAAGVWVTIVLEGHRDAANIYYDAYTVQGVRTPLTQSFPAPNLGKPDMLNVGQQLDGEKVPAAYTIAIDRMKLTGWTA